MKRLNFDLFKNAEHHWPAHVLIAALKEAYAELDKLSGIDPDASLFPFIVEVRAQGQSGWNFMHFSTIEDGVCAFTTENETVRVLRLFLDKNPCMKKDYRFRIRNYATGTTKLVVTEENLYESF